jgi:DNA-directed RNA polymerase specialized sigma24 family protein
MTTQAEGLRAEQLRALERWAVDPATTKRATRYLGTPRIPGEGTDIVQQAYLRVARRLQAGPLPHENVDAYANVAMKRVVLNMLRAKSEVSYLDDLPPRDVVVAPVEIGAAEDTADLIRTSVVAMTSTVRSGPTMPRELDLQGRRPLSNWGRCLLLRR